MTESDLQHVEDAFVAATNRSALAGCEYHTILDISPPTHQSAQLIS